MSLPADVFAALEVVRSQRRRAVLATVVESAGSAPQSPGARLLLADDGSMSGTVGGGAFEHAVLERARELLDGEEKSRLWKVSLTSIGMCCGGTMTVFLEKVPLSERLVIFGAGHVAAPLAALASQLSFAVEVVDARPEWATAERFPGARVICDDPEIVVREPLDAASAAVVMTHDHRLDQAVVKALLGSDAGFVGLIGSVTKRTKFAMRLAAQGMPEAQLARLRSPLGVHLGAVTPEEIAVSILAELVAWRRGVALSEGAPVRAKRRAEGA